MYITNILNREASNALTSLSGPATVALSPFAADPASAVRQIDIRIARPLPTRLVLDYELVGELSRLRLAQAGAPAGFHPQPTDGLWRHTCMEVFVSSKPADAYLEFNFAPDGRWAAYRFSGYRAGMAPLIGVRPPRIELRTRSERLLLSADVELPAELADAGLRVAIAAVVEDDQGHLDYWALRHAGPRPDFHHPESFGFEI